MAWNLVAGLHDAPDASERTVWVTGAPREVGPVVFGAGGETSRGAASTAPGVDAGRTAAGPASGAATPPGLAAVAFADGGSLRFTAEAARSRRENLLLVRSDYEQPFGTFAGDLPGAGPLREGFGVMERHDAVW